jgi:hypothetical protein
MISTIHDATIVNRTCQADCPVISECMTLKKLVVGREKKKYPARQCKVCAAHKKGSETRKICKLCVVWLQKRVLF